MKLDIKKLKFHQFKAFLIGRRSQMWLSFFDNLSDILWLKVWQILFSKNVVFYEKWNKDKSKKKVELFAFRNKEDKEKFLIAKELSWDDNLAKKSRLYGEALGYPEFAINDFIKLGEGKNGDRIGVKCFEWGYDGFVCRPENFEKMKNWLIEQKIPLEKVIISDNETGKWRHHSFVDYEKNFKK